MFIWLVDESYIELSFLLIDSDTIASVRYKVKYSRFGKTRRGSVGTPGCQLRKWHIVFYIWLVDDFKINHLSIFHCDALDCWLVSAWVDLRSAQNPILEFMARVGTVWIRGLDAWRGNVHEVEWSERTDADMVQWAQHPRNVLRKYKWCL